MLDRSDNSQTGTNKKDILNAIESTLASGSLDEIRQLIPQHLLNDVDFYKSIYLRAINDNRLDVLKMVSEQVPLSANVLQDDSFAHDLSLALFQSHNMELIRWVIEDNDFPAAQKEYIIEGAILQGNLEALKWLGEYSAYKDTLDHQGSNEYYKTHLSDPSIYGDPLPPVMAAVCADRLDILQWLVDVKKHSLDLPEEIFHRDMVHFTCSFTDDWSVSDEINVSERLNILKWLSEEKRLPLTKTFIPVWANRDGNQADLFELLLSFPGDKDLIFPIFQWLFTQKANTFKNSILASLANSLPQYLVKLSDDNLKAIFSFLMSIIRYASKSNDSLHPTNGIQCLLKVAACKQWFARAAFNNFEKTGIADNAIKQDLIFFCQAKEERILNDSLSLSDHGLRALIFSTPDATPDTLLRLYEKIKLKTPEEINVICSKIKSQLDLINLRDRNASIQLAEKMENYLDQATTLPEKKKLSYLEKALLTKIAGHRDLLYELNSAKTLYRRLLKTINEQLRNDFPTRLIDFAAWKKLYIPNSVEYILLSTMEGFMITNNPVARAPFTIQNSPPTITTFFIIYFSILENAAPHNLSLMDLLHDCMELINLRYCSNGKTMHHYYLTTIWETNLSGKERKAFFDGKLQEVKNRLAELGSLTSLVAGSASPFIAMLGEIRLRDKKITEQQTAITQLEERVKKLETTSGSSASPAFFQDPSKKRARDEEDDDKEHKNKRPTTLDNWLAKRK